MRVAEDKGGPSGPGGRSINGLAVVGQLRAGGEAGSFLVAVAVAFAGRLGTCSIVMCKQCALAVAAGEVDSRDREGAQRPGQGRGRGVVSLRIERSAFLLGPVFLPSGGL